ncbi:hypothetical protein [Cupriavidus taiwanensis]|uniref:hypothetical protein n=1 Tax=Cupriavidus taiwanensis TaxID=164546 RepID=UPI0011C12C0D|nr:hypothetical protein [Cupriavidus taiwanensis]
MGLLEQVPGNGTGGGQVIGAFRARENAPAGAFFFFQAGCWSAAAAEIVASEKNDKSGTLRSRKAGGEVLGATPPMYATTVNCGKIAQFFEVMLRATVSEMPNLLSEPDFSSYTVKTLLKSDVQPVQVVGPS